MKSIALLSFALLLFACGDATPDNATAPVDEMPVVEAPPATPQTNPLLQNTIDAVQTNGGDVTALPPATAVSNIDSWIGELRNMEGTDGIGQRPRIAQNGARHGQISTAARSPTCSPHWASSTRQVWQRQPPDSTHLASALDAGASKLGGK